MTRRYTFRNIAVRSIAATRKSFTWGKNNLGRDTSTLVFATLLIVCSLAVGCSSDKPKTNNSVSQSAATQPARSMATTPAPAPTTPVIQAAAKPIHRRVHKAPATLTYSDKVTGVSFQYPRTYSLKTGELADQPASSEPVSMGFAQPGGVPVVTVALPKSAYANNDLASASFGVSVNKSLKAEQCGEFSVPPASPETPADPATQATPQASKQMIGDLELQTHETIAHPEGREEISKFYHVFENESCYEFAVQVATTGSETEGRKHVNREEVFHRLGKILATIKINPVESAEVTASTPAAAPATPAQ